MRLCLPSTRLALRGRSAAPPRAPRRFALEDDTDTPPPPPAAPSPPRVSRLYFVAGARFFVPPFPLSRRFSSLAPLTSLHLHKHLRNGGREGGREREREREREVFEQPIPIPGHSISIHSKYPSI